MKLFRRRVLDLNQLSAQWDFNGCHFKGLRQQFQHYLSV